MSFDPEDERTKPMADGRPGGMKTNVEGTATVAAAAEICGKKWTAACRSLVFGYDSLLLAASLVID